MDDITIRFAGPDDAAAVAEMIDAMDRHYGDPETPPGRARSTVESWLRDGAAGRSFVLALSGTAPVGLASIGVLHPGTALQRVLFLKDIFVVEDRRDGGVGRRLMAFLAAHCRREGIGRIDWLTEGADAVRFYERLGARVMPAAVMMRLDGEALDALAGD